MLNILSNELIFCNSQRGVTADSDDTVKASADALGRRGFINYFGLQVI